MKCPRCHHENPPTAKFCEEWPPTQKGFGSAVLEQVMAEYFDAPTRIDFAMDGLCYQLNGSLGAMLQNGRSTVLPGGSR
jgi:hypothetical protein